jgi:methyl-accepting chemotaxis protein
MIAISDGALVVRNLTKTLVSGGGFLGPARKIVRAVNDISFTIPKSLALGLVGVLLVTLRRMLAPLRAIKTTTTELSAGDLTSTTILATNRSGEIACALVVLRDNLVERWWLRETAEAEALGKRARQEEVAKLIEDTIRALRQAAEKIGAVTGMIKAVADRTNMLSLNATIEAARAGDAGKGFAIGTSEVKGLAQQPTASTGEISALVASMQGHTQAAV